MRVALVNTVLSWGGASKACRRLQYALDGAGADTVYVCGESREGLDRAVIAPAATGPSFIKGLLAPDAGGFSIPALPSGLAGLPEIAGADAVNLHWVADYASASDVAAIGALGKPLVWTFHDYWPMTGGCHYPGDCDGYLRDCRDCPQLAPHAAGFAAWFLAEKKRAFAGMPIVAVSPSRALATDIGRSALFAGRRVEVIANPTDLRTFAPMDQRLARRRLGLPGDAFIVSFSSHCVADPRKGLADLCLALERAARLVAGEGASGPPGMAIMCLGELDYRPIRTNVPLILAGAVSDEARLAAMLAAADVCVSPSREDNLPNTLIESLACGVPAVAYGVGGIPEIIDHPEAGEVVACGDIEALTESLRRRLAGCGRPDALGPARRDLVRRKYGPEAIAETYLELYADVAAQSGKARSGPVVHPDPTTPPDLDATAGAALVCQRHSDRVRALEDALTREAFRCRDLKMPRACADIADALDPDGAWLDNFRFKACLLAGAGDCDQAVAIFQELLERFPWRVDIVCNLADALRYAGRLDKAAGLIEDAGGLFHESRGLAAAMAKVWLARGEKRKAALCLIRELRRYGDSWSGSKLVELLVQMGRPAMAARITAYRPSFVTTS